MDCPDKLRKINFVITYIRNYVITYIRKKNTYIKKKKNKKKEFKVWTPLFVLVIFFLTSVVLNV